MSATTLIWLWIFLITSSTVFLGLILKSVFNRLMSAAHQLDRVADKLALLVALLDEKPQIQAPESSLMKDPAIALNRRKALLKARIKKQEQRQRRLIASLKSFDPNESRFH